MASERFVRKFDLWEKNLQETRLQDRTVKKGPVNNGDEQGNSRHHILRRSYLKGTHKGYKDYLKTP